MANSQRRCVKARGKSCEGENALEVGMQLRCRDSFDRPLEKDNICVQHSYTCLRVALTDAFATDDEEKCHRQGEL